MANHDLVRYAKLNTSSQAMFMTIVLAKYPIHRSLIVVFVYHNGKIPARYFNGQKIESSERCLISFDGTYATLFIASCTMDDMGDFKVVFENKSGSDESTGKVTVKPVSAQNSCKQSKSIPATAVT